MIMCCLINIALEHVSRHMLRRPYARREPITSRHEINDSHNKIPLGIMNIIVAFVNVYGECLLTWLPWVCNHDLPSSLLKGVARGGSGGSDEPPFQFNIIHYSSKPIVLCIRVWSTAVSAAVYLAQSGHGCSQGGSDEPPFCVKIFTYAWFAGVH